MIAFADAKAAAGVFAALAEPTRVRIFARLLDGPHHVGQLAGLIGLPIANMSHHLNLMRSAGLLDHDKVGRRVIYSLRVDPAARPGPDDRFVVHAGPYRLAVKRNPEPPPVPAPKRSARKLRSVT